MLSFEPAIAREKVPAIVVCGVDGRTRTETIERILATGGTRWAVISNEVEGPEFASAAWDFGRRSVGSPLGALRALPKSP